MYLYSKCTKIQFFKSKAKLDKKQGPTVYSTGNYIQYPMINHNGKEYEKEYISICITKSLCNTPETNATL